MTTEHAITCPVCGAPVEPARRGDRSTWLDERGRGAGFSDAEEHPPTCSSPECDWEDREGSTRA